MEFESSLAEKLYSLEEQLLQPEVRKSREELAALLADVFLEFGSSGRIFSKDYIIEELPNTPSVMMNIRDFQAKVLSPELVLTTYRAVSYNQCRGQERHSLRSSIWRLLDGRWQMIFHQGTPTSELNGENIVPQA